MGAVERDELAQLAERDAAQVQLLAPGEQVLESLGVDFRLRSNAFRWQLRFGSPVRGTTPPEPTHVNIF